MFGILTNLRNQKQYIRYHNGIQDTKNMVFYTITNLEPGQPARQFELEKPLMVALADLGGRARRTPTPKDPDSFVLTYKIFKT